MRFHEFFSPFFGGRTWRFEEVQESSLRTRSPGDLGHTCYARERAKLIFLDKIAKLAEAFIYVFERKLNQVVRADTKSKSNDPHEREFICAFFFGFSSYFSDLVTLFLNLLFLQRAAPTP